MRTVRFKITALVLVGMLALAGCARNTEEALRVGDISFANSQIEQTAEPFAQAAGGAAGEGGTTDVVARVRQSVVQLTLFAEVAKRYAQEHGVRIDEPDYEGAAAALQLGVDDAYVRLNAEAYAYRNALLEDATARTPTEDEMRGVYDGYVAMTENAGGVPAAYEDIRAELLGFPEYGKALTLRDELVDAADRYGVTVHPRYQPAEFPLLSVANGQLTVVGLPFGEQGTGAIRPAS